MWYATQHPHHFRQVVAGRGFDESMHAFRNSGSVSTCRLPAPCSTFWWGQLGAR